MNLKLQDFIQKTISAFEIKHGIEHMWKPPLVATVPSNHPLVLQIKQSVMINHLLPEDILPGAKNIVVFFIPFENKIIESNLGGEAASEEWARAYISTNELIGFIGDETEKYLNSHGFRMGKIKATHNFDEKTLMSRWSHRHIAWASGLGTFGINNMLITSSGCCGRLGSFVTDADSWELDLPTEHSVPLPEKCLNKNNGSCGLCRKKCLAGAYKEEGNFDRYICYETCLKNADLYRDFGFADVCGKCLVGLPCSCKDPSLE